MPNGLKFVLSISYLLLICSCAIRPELTTPTSQIVEFEVPAPSLEGNLLGDPTRQRVTIYLPPSYSSSEERRYPVLYLLHGWAGTDRTWLIADDSTPDETTSDGNYDRAGFVDSEILDAQIEVGVIPELIIVAPNAKNALKHSFYVNSPVTGNWEDYIVEDVVSFIDSNFRTITAPNSRGIAGHSGGGNGALFLSMRHPDVFGSVYAMAPCCLGPTFSLPYAREISGEVAVSDFWREVFTRISSIETVEDLPASFTDRSEDFWVNAETAAAAAYAPNPDRSPFYGDYLFEVVDGNLVHNQEALDNRLALSVYHQIETHEENLRSLRGILIDYGEYEMDSLVLGNSSLVQMLSRKAIPFEFEVYKDGDHGNLIADRLLSNGLIFFAETLEFPN